MKAYKPTESSRTPRGSEVKGASRDHADPLKVGEMSSAQHESGTEEHPDLRATGCPHSSEEPATSSEPREERRGKAKKRPAHDDCVTGGSEIVDDGEPGRDKEIPKKAERRSKGKYQRRRESRRWKDVCRRDAPVSQAMSVTRDRMLDSEMLDQECQSAETQFSSGTHIYCEEGYRYIKLLALRTHKAAFKISTLSATKTSRSTSDLLRDAGSCCTSECGTRKGDHSTETTDLLHASKYKIVLVVALCVAFAVISLLVVHMMAKRGPPGAFFAPAVWIKDMEKHCSSPDCLTAARLIAASIDVWSNPCADFYAFTCGNWRSFAPVTNEVSEWVASPGRKVSYIASLRSDYVSAASNSLLRVLHASPVPDEQVTRMGQVFASCLAFFVDKPLNLATAWQAANIYTNLWLEAKTFQDSLFLAITHLLHSRLGSVLYVSYDGQVADISPGTAILRHVKAGFRRAVVIRAVKRLLFNNRTNIRQRSDGPADTINDSGAFGKMVDAVVNLDDFVFNQTGALPFSPVEIALNELDSSSWNWTEVFTGQSSVEKTASPMKARVTNIDAVRAILHSLSSQDDMMATKIYLMLVPLAKFFEMEERASAHRRVPLDDIRNELCVMAMETMFGNIYRRWIVTELAGSDAVDELRRILSGVVSASKNVLEISRGVLLDYSKMTALNYPTGMYLLINDSTPTVEANYGSDFVANAVLFVVGGGILTRPLLDFDAVSMDWSDREVAQRLVIPDFFYAHTEQAVLNYATVGYYLARLAFSAGSPWHETGNHSYGVTPAAAWDLSAYSRCLATYVKNISGLGVSGDEPWWRGVVETRWAVEVAFRAAAYRDANIARRRTLKQFFFLRLGQTFCSLPGNDQRESAAKACRMSAMTLPAFAGAFECPVVASLLC
ncbi:hypothetical protein HPB50_004283 [Hyalomma asiaticum]|uniref:Uncharacterized protein n=1 Tax=Hyalomma asiaticum TaxID=266040 RepID=A0ACB7TGY7_HYAAI|nr:hypothetical protein HPB50_004283 [Hyalomma asiaticum]